MNKLKVQPICLQKRINILDELETECEPLKRNDRTNRFLCDWGGEKLTFYLSPVVNIHNANDNQDCDSESS